MRIEEMVITNYSKKGHGLAHSPSSKQTIEIPRSVIGEVVQVELDKRRKGHILQILQPSPFRIQPPCPNFHSCGGCSLQHLIYEQQSSYKEHYVKKLFTDLIAQDNTQVFSIVAAKDTFSYRGKMEFTFSQDRAGKKYLGLMMLGGRVIDLQDCLIATPWMMKTLNEVKAWWQDTSLEAYYPPKDRGTLRTITLREGKNTGEKLVMLTVSGNSEYPLSQEDIRSFKKTIEGVHKEEYPCSLFIQVHQIHKGEPTQFFEMHLSGPESMQEKLSIEWKDGQTDSFTFAISPSSFFQPNTQQAEKLYSLALGMTSMTQESVVYDLYCGTATLGIIASKKVAKVFGIELNPYAICDAQVNCRLNNAHNVTLCQGDVGEVLKNSNYPKPDLVILDPPRSGLDQKALDLILELAPQEILYISCNPLTQHENILKILPRGYQLVTMQPVDQFPHTPHIENITLLRKKV